MTDLDAAAPDGAVIGILGEDRSGKSALLRLAAGLETPRIGQVMAPAPRRLLGPGDALNFAPVPLLLLDQTLAGHDLLVRERAVVALDRLRRSGTTTLVVSHEEDLLRRLADEIWWLQQGKLAARGAPDEVLSAYRKHIAQRIRAWGDTVDRAAQPAPAPGRRAGRDPARGDHRRAGPAHDRSGAAANWPSCVSRRASTRRWKIRWSGS